MQIVKSKTNKFKFNAWATLSIQIAKIKFCQYDLRTDLMLAKAIWVQHACTSRYLTVTPLWFSWGHCSQHKPCRTHTWWTLDYVSNQCLCVWVERDGEREVETKKIPEHCRIFKQYNIIAGKPTVVFNIRIYDIYKINTPMYTYMYMYVYTRTCTYIYEIHLHVHLFSTCTCTNLHF